MPDAHQQRLALVERHVVAVDAFATCVEVGFIRVAQRAEERKLSFRVPPGQRLQTVVGMQQRQRMLEVDLARRNIQARQMEQRCCSTSNEGGWLVTV